MASERWREVRDVFDAALDLEESARTEFLDRACDGKAVLRSEVESLLSASSYPTDFLENSPLITEASVSAVLIVGPVIGHQLGPYQITKLIGEGGMASVYEAVRVDGQFEHRVAVKMVKPGLLPDSAAARFRTERQILAGLRHPNIAQLHDGGVSHGVPYFILELVEGRHIDEYCLRHALPVEQRLELFRKVCDAVQYAHAKNIVHRDIKPGNILVNDDGVPKLLDFGIAKMLDAGFDQPATRAADRMATPLYASPEQIAGSAVTVGSDVYSLGILLYVLVSGQPLSQASGSSDDVLKRIRQGTWDDCVASENGRALPSKLKRALHRVVQNAVHGEVESRYRTVRDLSLDVQCALEGSSVSARGGGLLYRTRTFVRHQRTFVTGIAALLVALAIPAAFLMYRIHPPSSAARRSLAVVGFQNLSKAREGDWLSTALSEMFTTELAANSRLRVVSGDRVSHARRDLGLREFESGGASEWTRLGRNLDAQYTLTGSFLPDDSNAQSLRLYIRLQDARSGETLLASTERGFENELPALVFRSATQLQHQLGIGLAAGRPVAVYARDPRTLRLYSEGLSEQRRGDVRSARKSFEKALAIEPRSAVVRSSYASTLALMGYDRQALSEAKTAFESASGLPREERLLLEGRYHEYAAEWQKAIENYKTLWNLFYDNIDYGILLAHAQNRAGQADQALHTIAAVNGSANAEGTDPRATLERAGAYLLKGEFEAARKCAQSAREGAQKLGARTWVADAYALEGAALNSQSKYGDAVQAYSFARQIYGDLRDEAGVATSLKGMGVANSEQGNYSLAEQYYSEALKAFSALGFRRAEAITLSNLSLVRKSQADFPAALNLMERSIAVQESLGDKSSLSHSLLNYGSTLRKLNQLEKARDAMVKSLALAREIGDNEQIVRTLVMLGDTDLDAGDVVTGLAQEEEALALHSRSGTSPRVRALVLQHVARARQHMGKLREAESGYQASLEIGRRNNFRQFVSDNLVMLSEVARQRGDLTTSNSLADAAAQIYEKEHQREGLLDVRLARAKNDFAANRMEGLRERLEQCVSGFRELGLATGFSEASMTLAAYWLAHSNLAAATSSLALVQTPRFELRIQKEIISARIAAARGNSGRSERRLQTLASDLKAKQWITLGLEARAAAVEVESHSGRGVAGKHLADLRKDMYALGFGLPPGTPSGKFPE